MKIIFKYLIRNIFKNKTRTILIITSILLSTALLFSTLALSKTMEKMYLEQMYKQSGSAEVMVVPNETQLSSPFFTPVDISSLDQKLEYYIEATTAIGKIEINNRDKFVSIQGLSFTDLKLMHQSEFVDIVRVGNFVGNNVIIGIGDAQEHNLDVGDIITLNINNQNHEFTVYAIAENADYFLYDGLTINAVIPTNTIAQIYGYDGMVNALFFKTTTNYQPNQLIAELFEFYHDYTVRETISIEFIRSNMSMITTPFSLMLVLVIFISIFIINTSFKVITVERIPMIGTFRSVGATKKSTSFILFGESFILGIIGGIFGILLGFVVLRMLMSTLAYNTYTNTTLPVTMVFSVYDLLIAFLGAVILSIVGSLLPIFKTNKISVKDILLNNLKKEYQVKTFKPLIGFILVFVSILNTLFNPIYPNMLVGFIMIIAVVIGIIFIIPTMTKLFVSVFSKLNSIFFGNIGEIAVKNLKTAKNLINNITLLVIGIGGIIMINTVSQTFAIEVTNAYGLGDYEIRFNHVEADDQVVNRLANIDGVDEVYPFYMATNIRYLEKNQTISFVYGIDANRYFEYWDLEILGDTEGLKQQLKTGDYILTSIINKNRYGLEIGDTVTLELNRKQVEYEIIGFINTLMDNGSFVYLDQSNLHRDMEFSYYSQIYIKTSLDDDDIIKAIEAEFGQEIYASHSMAEQAINNKKANQQIFDALIGFSIVAIVIGSFGVFNNFVVSFLNRKREIAIYRSVGMSQKESLKMMVIEALNTGVIGGVIAIGAGVLLITIAEYILKAMFLPVKMHYNIVLFVFAFISAILIAVVSALSPIIKSSKLSIVDEIKFK